ncbi:MULTISPECIES: helix-turn-helix domain-containing protein [Alistipes]|uniref:helix-turn-helix domain-containing protein n=1 Tax=Alistipes TaxID=239759 RepID=UPI001D3B8C2A|nr:MULTISPECIES: helix-turn-helix transcriptional regulator [Alistipes]MBS1365900.1 helix-turn-helix transcriptional regulator [Alistipes sp.]HJG75176.1 helix-turn-helix transcriptional regulator [Alistipes ihumii]
MELRVKELCKEKGLQMQELADKLGITRITLTRNISGNPTISTLENIAAALGVSVPELFAPQPTNTITCPKCGTVLEVKERDK